MGFGHLLCRGPRALPAAGVAVPELGSGHQGHLNVRGETPELLKTSVLTVKVWDYTPGLLFSLPSNVTAVPYSIFPGAVVAPCLCNPRALPRVPRERWAPRDGSLAWWSRADIGGGGGSRRGSVPSWHLWGCLGSHSPSCPRSESGTALEKPPSLLGLSPAQT